MNLPSVALSINQPWAWLIATGLKDIENRNWTTEFRGEFLIHAGKKIDKGADEDLRDGLHPVTGRNFSHDRQPTWQTGGIIGIAEVAGVITKRTGGDENDWFVGRYGFVIRNARPIEFIPCVGALGFFKPDFSRQYAPPYEPKRKKAEPAPEPQSGGLFE